MFNSLMYRKEWLHFMDLYRDYIISVTTYSISCFHYFSTYNNNSTWLFIFTYIKFSKFSCEINEWIKSFAPFHHSWNWHGWTSIHIQIKIEFASMHPMRVKTLIIKKMGGPVKFKLLLFLPKALLFNCTAHHCFTFYFISTHEYTYYSLVFNNHIIYDSTNFGSNIIKRINGLL